jgi:hypothetical protein
MAEPPIPVEFERRTPPPPRRSGNAGCLIAGVLTLLVAGGLVALALFLPPFRVLDRLTGPVYTALSADSNGVVVDGMTFAVSPDDPGQGFGVRISSTDALTFQSAPGNLLRTNVPPNLALQGSVYAIETDGAQPATVTLSLAAPAQAVDERLLDLFGWYSAEQAWRFIPSRLVDGQVQATVAAIPDHVAVFQTSPASPTVLVAYDVTTSLTGEIAQVATIVAPAGLQPAGDGSLTGSLAPGFDLNGPYEIMPVVRNYTDPRVIDSDTIASILANPQLADQHARQIVSMAVASGFDGVFVDYRDVAEDQRAAFADFIARLGELARESRLMLGVAVPAARAEGVWTTGAYDWQRIGQAVDYLQIDVGPDPRQYAAGETQFLEAMANWATREVDRSKILLGISAQSVREAGGAFTSISFDDAIAGLGDVQVAAETSETGDIRPGSEITATLDGLAATSGFEATIDTPYIDYRGADDAVLSRMWLATGEALRYRLERTLPFAVAGVAFDDLLRARLADDALAAVIAYKAGLPAPQVPDADPLQLRWDIADATGSLDTAYTAIGDQLVVTLQAPEGNYAINVAVVNSNTGSQSQRSGQAVALFNPTATPTPLPTATATPVPTVTPTPAPIAVAAGGGSGAQVAPPAAGSIVVGNFDYGGHVTSTGSGRAVQAMRQAGMSWMKVQIRHNNGDGPGAAAEAIATARNNGFRVLIGTVGNPNQLGAGGQGYVDAFTNWLAGIAAAGPDAIEVWNEPNLDREWPTGQISGTAYASLLAQAYRAIKGANPNVMVIGGAPAPTGAEAAYPGQVMNDDRWLREVVAAGGLNSMDCVGAHYNEGIVSPTQTSGDPRDNYYTRYFPTMLSTYWNIIGGAKPLCFTELGYLSPEGFPPLPAYFAWAQNVTVAQQAAWLAEAAALSSNSGKVALMIVWNVDFSGYDSDPQAGYAMIRPDGSCPACAALANAR